MMGVELLNSSILIKGSGDYVSSSTKWGGSNNEPNWKFITKSQTI